MDLLAIDYLTIGPAHQGYEHCLVMIDHFTKFAVVTPTRDQTAESAAHAICKHFIQVYGCPKRIHSDQGACFLGRVMEELHQLYKIDKSRTTPYHPQGNGACERFNRTLIQMLRTLEEDQKAKWTESVPELVWAYNNRKHSTTGFTPYSLFFGRPGKGLAELALEPEEDYPRTGVYSWVQEHRRRLRTIQRLVQDRLQELEHPQVAPKKGTALWPGDRVLVREKRPHNKLEYRWEKRPYRVKRRLSNGGPVYEVQPETEEGTPTRTLHRNMLRPCLSRDPESVQLAPAPPPAAPVINVDVEDEEDFESPPVNPGTGLVPDSTNVLEEALTPPTAADTTAPAGFRRSEHSTAGVPPVRYNQDEFIWQQIVQGLEDCQQELLKISPVEWRAERGGECKELKAPEESGGGYLLGSVPGTFELCRRFPRGETCRLGQEGSSQRAEKRRMQEREQLAEQRAEPGAAALQKRERKRLPRKTASCRDCSERLHLVETAQKDCIQILPPIRHQSVLLLLLLSYMLHSAAVCEAPKMGSLILTTCILSTLVSMGYSITCFVCRTETESTCTGEERSCPKDYVCASTSTITIMDGMQSKVFTRSCERRNACGVIGTIGYQRGQVKTATSCCYTDSCFPSTPALPLDEARKNGLTCSSCTAHDSAWCMSKEKIDCTGQESKCIFMNHVYSGAKHSKNAFRGCGTKAICDLGSQSHNYGGVSLRTEITCSNLGSTIHSGVFILLVAVAISSKFIF
ncbi:uncharacterized protein LOC143770475 [Ranitomeya variabilis]|uniref:uncharacterized protein LOC143770475 n=1 Tax=Ranitomeya variabilis TaxID=490064 RepID=UPI004055DB50